jgi:XRE family transcriptional regulator, master regulator for biofilm formation
MIGQRVKNLRKIKGYSISELAKLANVSKSYLSQIERDLKTNPSLQFLNKLAKTLDTSIDYLLDTESTSDQSVVKVDKEWESLVNTAIKVGISKAEFQVYLNYLKFEKWKEEQRETKH